MEELLSDNSWYGKNISQNHDLVGGGQHRYNGRRILFLCGEGDCVMTFKEIKATVWNLIGAGVYWCVGIGAILHTILGY